jgi:ERCC4-type nuclease
MQSINNNYYYTDKEIKAILDSIIIIIDTRENDNKHIIDYFEKKKISYEIRKLDTGDYSFAIHENLELNISRKIYFYKYAVIERKAHLDELAGNLTTDRQRIENELIRSTLIKNFQILIEDVSAYENMITANYRSQYDAKAFLATFLSFASRFHFNFIFLNKKLSGNYIYHYFYYYLRNYLLNKLY